MTFKIHFEHQDETPDYFIISGDTNEEIEARAFEEFSKRNGKNPWSEEIKLS